MPDKGSLPPWPLLVASALAATVSVSAAFVTAVVEKVMVVGSALVCASLERKTRAAPGAGTGI